jgi:hypothetical protein
VLALCIDDGLVLNRSTGCARDVARCRRTLRVRAPSLAPGPRWLLDRQEALKKDKAKRREKQRNIDKYGVEDPTIVSNEESRDDFYDEQMAQVSNQVVYSYEGLSTVARSCLPLRIVVYRYGI